MKNRELLAIAFFGLAFTACSSEVPMETEEKKISTVKVDDSLSPEEKFKFGMENRYNEVSYKELEVIISYIPSACNDGHAEACFETGFLKDDVSEILKYWEKSCEGGFAKACVAMADWKWNKRNVNSIDFPELNEWYIQTLNKACGFQSAKACAQLSSHLQYDDKNRSNELLKIACDLDAKYCR